MNRKKTLILSLILIFLIIGFVSGCGKNTNVNNSNNINANNLNSNNINMAPDTEASRIDFYVFELQSAKSGYAVIFTSGEKFVQFEVDGTFLLDIPNQQLTTDQKTKLITLLGSTASQGTASVNATFNTVDEAAEMTEKVFTQVYGLPESYEVTSEVIK